MRDIPVLSPIVFFEACDGLDATADALLAVAVQGDSGAFEAFYSATVRHLLGGVRRICGDDYAEDVLADTYFQVWQSLHTWDCTRGSAMAWLRMVASSRARDRARRERIRHGGLAGAIEHDADAQVCAAPRPDEQAQARQESRLLHAALTAFPSATRPPCACTWTTARTRKSRRPWACRSAR